jgi:hypothetical protein
VEKAEAGYELLPHFGTGQVDFPTAQTLPLHLAEVAQFAVSSTSGV